MKIPTGKSCEKPRPRDLLEQQYNFTVPNHKNGKRFWSKFAVMAILTIGTGMLGFALSTPHLATFRTTLDTGILYFADSKDYRITSSLDVDMGALEMCFEARTPYCANWGGSNERDASDRASQLKAPDWLLGTQKTSIAGMIIAAITDVIVCIHVIRPDLAGRVFPFIICLGSLIAGTLVFIGSALFAFNYKSISNHDGFLDGLNGGFTWTQADFSFSLSWGFALEVISIVLMWISALLIVLGCRRVKNTDENRMKNKLFFISNSLITSNKLSPKEKELEKV